MKFTTPARVIAKSFALGPLEYFIPNGANAVAGMNPNDDLIRGVFAPLGTRSVRKS